MEEIATHLVLALRKKQPRGPYKLGGYCLSAIFAYEVARQLTMLGQHVGLLVLLEPLNPHQSALVRLKTALRRMGIVFNSRLNELRRIENSVFPAYAHSRWKGFKSILRDELWRISARSKFLNPQRRSSDLE